MESKLVTAMDRDARCVTITLDEAPDGRWTFSWWCAMPTNQAEFADGEGSRAAEQQAIDAAMAEPSR